LGETVIANQTLYACSDGQICIRAGVDRYFLASGDVRALLFYGGRIPVYQGYGVIDAEASVYIHPGRKGIVISLMGCSWLVPRETFKQLARGALAETRMQPISCGGPVP